MDFNIVFYVMKTANFASEELIRLIYFKTTFHYCLFKVFDRNSSE